MRDVIPMLKAISIKLYNNFKDEFKDLAMDIDDLEQEGYIYYLDFEKRFAHKFREDVMWSAIRQYVIWKLMEKVYNWKKKGVYLVSLDTELGIFENSNGDKEKFINEEILKGKGEIVERKSPLKDSRELNKLLLKIDPEFNFNNFKKMFGKKKFNIFIDVLKGEETQKEIGKRHKVTKQYVGKVYRKALKKLKLQFYNKT